MAKEKVLDEDGMEVDAIYRDDRKRKSLAIDMDTYWKLREICAKERRTLIMQLQLLIENRYGLLSIQSLTGLYSTASSLR